MSAMVAKEWRRLLRSPATPWAVGAYLLLPVLVTGAYLATMTSGPGIDPYRITQLGGQVLSLVGTWQILLLAAGSAFVASGLIASEVEEGTMPSLLAAGPSLSLLLLAKALGAVGFLLVLLVAGLPLFTVPVMVGGINDLLIARTVLLELTTVFMMTGLGLLLSAFGRRTGSVALVGVALAMMLTLGGGLINSTAPGQIPSREEIMMQAKMGVEVVTLQIPAKLPAWLYVNPLVGLNSAMNQSAGQGIFGLPGATLGPVYKGLGLWQVQAVGALLLLVIAIPVAVIVVRIRTRWRWPVIRLRQKEGIDLG